MTDDQTARIAARWLTRLYALCRHETEEPLTAQKLGDLAELLASEFPAAAFTTAALGNVAAGSDWFPALNTIRERLAHEHPRPALAAPDRAGELDAMDRRWVAYLNANIGGRRQQERDNAAELAGKDPWQWPVAHLASLVRGQSMRAWAAIVAAENEWRNAA